MRSAKSFETVEDGGGSGGQAPPEIVAQVSGKSVLLKILCEKRKGVLVKILAKVENLNLSVVNTSMLPFGSSIFDVKILAEMDEGIDLASADIVKALQSALLDNDD